MYNQTMNPTQQTTSTKRQDHHLISPTAKLVAHLRAETDIPYSKQIDELCEAGKTTEGLFGKREALVWMSAMLESRYKSLSALLKREMKEKGITQVLELACGIQPRGLLESSDPAVTYIETDLPEMAKEKIALVNELEPTALERQNYSILPLNILDKEQLDQVAAKFGQGKIAIINEGLLPYLSKEEKAIAAGNIHSVLKERGGVWITPDVSNRERMRKLIEMFPGAGEATQKISMATGRNMKENGIGDLEATRKFYSDLGFNTTEYIQGNFVSKLVSMDSINDPKIRSELEAVMAESNLWVFEVKKD
jgi:O-methyltransferase involved in polyketide biosynthesis